MWVATARTLVIPCLTNKGVRRCRCQIDRTRYRTLNSENQIRNAELRVRIDLYATLLRKQRVQKRDSTLQAQRLNLQRTPSWSMTLRMPRCRQADLQTWADEEVAKMATHQLDVLLVGWKQPSQERSSAPLQFGLQNFWVAASTLLQAVCMKRAKACVTMESQRLAVPPLLQARPRYWMPPVASQRANGSNRRQLKWENWHCQ